MTKNDMVIGIESHLRTIIVVIDQLRTMINSENNRILFDGQAVLVLNDDVLQEKKLHLYRRFETLARIITRIAKYEKVTDRELAKTVIRGILEVRRIVMINNILMQNHIEQRHKLIASIMAGIEAVDVSDKKDTHEMEQSLCR